MKRVTDNPVVIALGIAAAVLAIVSFVVENHLATVAFVIIALITMGYMAIALRKAHTESEAALQEAELTHARRLQEVERDRRQKTQIIERFVERIKKGPPRENKVRNWRHVYTYSAGGNAIIQQWEEIVNGPLALQFTQHTFISSGPMDPMTKEAVKIEANRVNDDGTLGVHIEQITTKWLDDCQLEATLHLLDEILPNQTFTVYMQWTWPRVSENLLKGDIEDFYWTVPPGTTEGISVEVIFDNSCKLKRDLKINEYQGCPKVRQTPFGGGRKLEWNYVGPFPDAPVGFQLDSTDAF